MHGPCNGPMLAPMALAIRFLWLPLHTKLFGTEPNKTLMLILRQMEKKKKIFHHYKMYFSAKRKFSLSIGYKKFAIESNEIGNACKLKKSTAPRKWTKNDFREMFNQLTVNDCLRNIRKPSSKVVSNPLQATYLAQGVFFTSTKSKASIRFQYVSETRSLHVQSFIRLQLPLYNCPICLRTCYALESKSSSRYKSNQLKVAYVNTDLVRFDLNSSFSRRHCVSQMIPNFSHYYYSLNHFLH